MDAQEMKERLFLHCCIAHDIEREWEQEGHTADFAAGLAMGRALGLESLIESLALTGEFNEWSEEHEKDKNSQKN